MSLFKAKSSNQNFLISPCFFEIFPQNFENVVFLRFFAEGGYFKKYLHHSLLALPVYNPSSESKYLAHLCIKLETILNFSREGVSPPFCLRHLRKNRCQIILNTIHKYIKIPWIFHLIKNFQLDYRNILILGGKFLKGEFRNSAPIGGVSNVSWIWLGCYPASRHTHLFGPKGRLHPNGFNAFNS